MAIIPGDSQFSFETLVFKAIKNSNFSDPQNQVWEQFTTIAAENVVGWEVLPPPGDAYANALGTPNYVFPSVLDVLDFYGVTYVDPGPPYLDFVTDFPFVLTNVGGETESISEGVCTGMMVLEEDDYIEVGAELAPGFLLDIPSLKVVRIGIGNFL